VVVSFMAMSPDGAFLFDLLQLDKQAVAQGEYYRLWTVTLLHDPRNLLHLFFNMYALYICGPLLEQLYGSRLFVAFYLLCAAAGSVASFVFGGDAPSIGASGAVFGLFGLLLAASRTHHPVLDRRSGSIVGQIGMLIVLNLVIGFALGAQIDNAAHVGGLVAGLWLGFLIVPGRVSTLRSMWRRPAGEEASGPAPFLVPALGVAALLVVLAVGLVVGTAQRSGSAVTDAPEVVTALTNR
jgi:membrane associated rhomboid family serine protease